jgi:hypothetical protein
MAWQTSEMVENGPAKDVVQSPEAKRFQYLKGKKVFAVAPMIDWTGWL